MIGFIRATILLALCLGGCQTAPPMPPSTSLDAGCSLLNELMRQESRLSGVLLLRHPSQETTAMIREITARAKRAASELETWRLEVPVIATDRDPLSPIERKVREAIAARTTRELAFGRSAFETRLLLSQVEALRYGRHLAIELAKIDPNHARADWLNELAADLAALRKRCLELID